MTDKFEIRLLDKDEAFDPSKFRDFQSHEGPARQSRRSDREATPKRRSERAQLLNGLFLADRPPTVVNARPEAEPPDFEVRLSDGTLIYVEVTEAALTEHAHLQATARNLDRDVMDWATSRQDLMKKFEGLGFQITLAEPVPERRATEVLEEAKRFFEEVDPTGYEASFFSRPSVPTGYALLHALGGVIVCHRREDGTTRLGVNVQLGWNPWREAAGMRDSIVEKCDKAIKNRWTVRPLWLIVDVSTPLWLPDRLAEALIDGGLQSIDPFEVAILAGRLQGVEIIRTSPKGVSKISDAS